MAVYYVKNGGSDVADGLSDATAWASITKVNATATSGDTVNFARGSTFTSPGLNPAANNITYQDYGSGALPLIDRNNTGLCIAITGRSGIVITNIDTRRSNSDGIFIQTNGASVILNGVIARDNANDGFKFQDSTTGVLNNCEAYNNNQGAATDGFSLHDSASATLNNCSFHDNTNGVSNQLGTTCTINGGSFYDNSGFNIRVASSGSGTGIITCNRVEIYGGGGLVDDSSVKSTITLNYCFLHDCLSTFYMARILATNSVLTINNCVFYKSAGFGVHTNGTLTIRNSIFKELVDGNYINGTDSADISGMTLTNSLFDKSADNISNQSSAFQSAFGSSLTILFSTDPLLVDPANGNIRLTKRSLAIDHGVNVSIGTDYYGASVSNPPDIGAAEFTRTFSYKISELEVGDFIRNPKKGGQVLQLTRNDGNSFLCYPVKDPKASPVTLDGSRFYSIPMDTNVEQVTI